MGKGSDVKERRVGKERGLEGMDADERRREGTERYPMRE